MQNTGTKTSKEELLGDFAMLGEKKTQMHSVIIIG
jgi:hypothetical protein